MSNDLEKYQTNLVSMINKMKKPLADALPANITADRFSRIVLTELRMNPKLAYCTPQSFLGSIMRAASLGIEIGTGLGQGYLVPFKNKGVDECTFILGYKGMIDLARRSGQMQSITARLVHANDFFECEFGLNEKLIHRPVFDDAGPMRFVYAVAKLSGDGHAFDIMSASDVDKIRATSKASSSGPWVTFPDEMAKKTIIRRLFKYLPVSIQAQQAAALDEAADLGTQAAISPTIFDEIDITPIVVTEEDAKTANQRAMDELAETLKK